MHTLPQLVLQGQLFALAQNMALQSRQKAAGSDQQQRADGHGDKRLRRKIRDCSLTSPALSLGHKRIRPQCEITMLQLPAALCSRRFPAQAVLRRP